MARKQITEFNEKMIGKEITCMIQNDEITSGKIQFENGKYYICHDNDKRQGSNPSNTLGYRFAWTVLEGKASNFRTQQITKIYFKNESDDSLLEDSTQLSVEAEADALEYEIQELEGMPQIIKDILLSELNSSKKKLKTNTKEVTTVTKEGDVENIVIPRGMSKLTASEQLKKQHTEEETIIELYQGFFKWDTEDALVAIMRTLKKTFGWVAGQETRSRFGSTPPAEFNVITDIVDGKETHESCFHGQFGIAQWDDAKGNTGVSHDGTFIKFTLKKKFTERAKQFFNAVEETLKSSSIFKGKSLVLTYNQDYERTQLTFCENKGSKNIILNEDEERVVQNLVINPLGKEGKRCILFTGCYGTGKTETAMRIGREANLKGITFIYCKDSTQFSNLLTTAKQYQPAVIFLEDIDEIGGGEDRDADMNDILNTLDGVQTKGNNITTIFTTNHENRINKALRRPGRIDIVMKFDKCSQSTIKKIYDRMFSGFKGVKDLDTELLSKETPIIQGAIIAEIVERSKRIAESIDGNLTNEIVLTAITSMKDHIEFMEADPEKTVNPKILAIDTIAKAVVAEGKLIA